MENQRVRLTKTMLRDALVSLLREKQLDRITVSEICDTAQVNRTTFYKHYRSPSALLEDVKETFLTQLDNDVSSIARQGADAALPVLRHLYERRETFCVLVRAIPGQAFSDDLLAIPAVRSLLGSMERSEGQADDQAARLRRFVFQGTFAILCDWLSGRDPCSASELADTLLLVRDRLLPNLEAHEENMETKATSRPA